MATLSPAFQFYPNDWLSSPKIMLMTPAEEGAYIRLLAISWNDPDCSLPDDDAQLAVLSRLGQGWLANGSNQSSTVIRKCFKPHPNRPGRIYNERLYAERQKQAAWREKSAIGGKKSAVSRSYKSKGGSQMVDEWLEPNANSSSSSSSSKYTSTKGTGLPATEAEAADWASLENVPRDFALQIFNEKEGTSWVDGKGASITNWRSYIKSRYSRSQTVKSPNRPHSGHSIMDLKSIIAAKQVQANQIKNEFCSEVAMGEVWSNKEKKIEWRKLCAAIGELTDKIAKSA